MTYEIRENHTYNSNEVYFDGKPSEAVRNALKSLKMRWNSAKKCWYGFAKDYEITSAILNTNKDEAPAEESATVRTDGYMGGGGYFGSKSHKLKFGAEQCKQFREDIKRAGLKGITVRVKHFDNYTFTIKTTAADFVPENEYINNFEHFPNCNWLACDKEDGEYYEVSWNDFYKLPATEQKETWKDYNRHTYRRVVKEANDLNQYHLDQYAPFSPDFKKKIETLNSIIMSWNYDESNAMVDYFDAGFYYTITTTPAQK